MARTRLPASRQVPPELLATQGMLDRRWVELSRLLATTLGLSIDARALRVEAESQGNKVWVGLQGAACERVTRNRGGSTLVAPLCTMAAGLTAWLGWQEAWEMVPGPKPFRFRNAGITIYVGKPHEALKPQVLRLEWPGISNWSGGEVSFQSPGAGHPHWQIDILQSLARAPSEAVFKPDGEELVEDFEAVHREPTTLELLQRLSIDRMHFASAAPWWLPAAVEGRGHHMNAPEDMGAITRWLEQSLRYVIQELSRCEISA